MGQKTKQKIDPGHRSTIVILGGGLLQTPMIREARKKGWRTIVADQNPDAPGLRYADLFLNVSTSQPDKLIEAIEKTQTSFNETIHYCATTGSDMSFSVAAINKHFNLPGILPPAAEVTTDKGKMRQFLKRLKLPQPPFFVHRDKAVLGSWIRKHGSKDGFVLKPLHNMGARGVLFLDNENDLAFAHEFAAAHSRTGELIIEHFIPAKELSADLLVLDNKVWLTGLADRVIERRDGRFFIETGHTLPSSVSNKTTENIINIFSLIAEALGKLSGRPYRGALKGDLRLQEDGTLVIGEVASRLSGGFMSTHTYPIASGNNLPAAFLDILQGVVPPFIKTRSNNRYHQLAMERAIICPPGILHKNTGVKDLPPHQIFEHHKKNSLIKTLQSNLGKVANIILPARNLSEGNRLVKQCINRYDYHTTPATLPKKEITALGRKLFNPRYCHLCQVCDGKHCASGVPGMGAVDDMKGFRVNIEDLNRIVLTKPKKIQYHANPDTKTSPTLNTRFCGTRVKSPVLNAPITGSITNFGGSITEYDLAVESGWGADMAGVPALFGDGGSPDKYLTAIEAIRQTKRGFLTIKPRKDNRDIIKRIKAAEAAGADGWGIDIDAVGLATMENKNQPLSHKTLKDLKEIAKSSPLPFFIKGILTIEKGLMAAESGASTIIISNHGGRIDNNWPSSASVIEQISIEVKKRYPGISVFADGGVRSGEDVFKMIALGADGVLVGRPVAIAAVAAGRTGVYSVLTQYKEELIKLMALHRISNIKKIDKSLVKSPF